MRQKLGQHFLINKRKIEDFVSALELKNKDVVIEIGPGRGAITMPLVKKCHEVGCKVIAIEKDEVLAGGLRNKIYDSRSNLVEVIKGDVLKILPVLAAKYQPLNTEYKLVGNIPYYITGYLLRTIGELKNKPTITVLGVQKEVAERMVAKPPKMNLLAATVQLWAKPKIISKMPKGDFRPQPKVDSAIVKLGIKEHDLEKMDNYYKVAKLLFRHPRKMALNNLITPETDKSGALEQLQEAGINPSDRPHNLSIDDIKNLA